MASTTTYQIFDPTDLRSAEKNLLEKVAGGEWQYCRSDRIELDEVRASFLRHLILKLPVESNGGQPWPIQSSGIQLCSARIIGTLNLKDGRSPVGGALPNLELENCEFDSPVWLDFAHFQRLSLKGSIMPQMSATKIRVDGDLNLERIEVFTTISGDPEQAAVSLRGAHIEGRLNLFEAALNRSGASKDQSGSHVFGKCIRAANFNDLIPIALIDDSNVSL